MTTYPLPTVAPTITSAGISAPPYNDILLSFIASYQGVYGSDIDVSDPSTQDYQWLAVLADAQNDTNNAIIATYNAYSPATAIGAGLSSVVKINGIRRDVATESSVAITIGGVADSVITNGLVGDNQGLGTQWALPASVTIGGGGTVTVTAECTVAGATAAAANTLTVILNPQLGWQTANNSGEATPGAPIEDDAQLRMRQADSVALAAETPTSAIYANVANVPGVGRVQVYVNSTSGSVGGIPANSIAVVCDSGAEQAIINAIGATKAPGIPTYGTGSGSTSGTYVDPAGISQPINFSYTDSQRIVVAFTLVPGTGWASSTVAVIQAALVAYISMLPIGTNVDVSIMLGVATLAGTPLAQTFNITLSTFEQCIYGGSLAQSDIAIAFYEGATLQASDITITT